MKLYSVYSLKEALESMGEEVRVPFLLEREKDVWQIFAGFIPRGDVDVGWYVASLLEQVGFTPSEAVLATLTEIVEHRRTPAGAKDGLFQAFEAMLSSLAR